MKGISTLLQGLKYCLAFLLFISLAGKVFGQDKDIALGEAYYENVSYAKAIEHFLMALEKEENQEDAELMAKLADCYRLTGNTKEAASWYLQSVDSGKVAASTSLHLGQVLMMEGQYEEAKKWFLEYAKQRPGDPRGKVLANSCSNIGQYKSAQRNYSVSSLPLSSDLTAFSPAFYGEDLVFVTERQDFGIRRNNTWTGGGMLDLYVIRKNNNGDWQEPKLFSARLKSSLNEGPATFTRDGKTIYFTRNHKSSSGEKVKKLQILSATRKGGGWSQPKPLSINSKGYNVAHPSISADGQFLYFMSDMPGSKGGSDIYVSRKSGDSWGAPQNLGSEINTKGNEAFPFIHPDGTLYFSSDAHEGMGGLDIHIARNNNGKWTRIKNMGFPVNSAKDDFGIIVDKDYHNGYFSSNRSDGTDNLYKIRILQKDDIMAIQPEGLAISGKLTDDSESAVEGINVTLFNEDKTAISSLKTLKDGTFRFEMLTPDQQYMIKVDEPEDTELYIEMDLSDNSGTLESIERTKVKDHYFKFEKLPAMQEMIRLLGVEDTELEIDEGKLGFIGKVTDQDQQPQTGVSMILYDENRKVISRTKTDDKGIFRFENLPADVNYMFQIDDENDAGFLVDMFMQDDKGGLLKMITRRSKDGMFLFENLPASSALLSMMEVEDTELSVDDGELAIFGKIADGSQLPQGGVSLSLYDENRKVIQRTQTDDKGIFKFENLPSDKNYRIKIDEADDSGFLVDMFMRDDQGNTIKLIKSKDAEGMFAFENLPAALTDMALMAVEDTDLFIDEGNIGLKGMVTDPSKNPQEGVNMVLLDENRKVISRTKTNDKGQFIFENLPSDMNYMIMVDEENDAGFLVDMFMEDDKGNTTRLRKRKNADGLYIFENLPAASAMLSMLGVEDTELKADEGNFGIFGKVGDENSPVREGVKMALTDENGNIIARTTTDSKGIFKFENLPSDKNYRIKIDEADDQGFLVDMFMADDQGHTRKLITQRGADGLFMFENLPVQQAGIALLDISDTELAIDEGNMGIFGKLGGEDPDAGKNVKMSLLDEMGNVVATTTTDEDGVFTFENLPTNKNFRIRIDDATDEGLLVDMFMQDDKGNARRLATQRDAGGLYIFESLPSEKSLLEMMGVRDTDLDIEEGNIGLMGNISNLEKLPREGIRIMLLDENDNVVATAMTDEKGNFTFENLPGDLNYRIKVDDDSDAALLAEILMADDKGNIKRLVKRQTETGLFEFENLPATKSMLSFLGVEDTELSIDEGQMGLIGKLENSDNLPREGVKMMLLDENDNVIGTAMTDDQGIFTFENLPADLNYRIKIDDDSDEGALVEMFMEDDRGNVKRLIKKEADQGLFEFENLPASKSMIGLLGVSDTELDIDAGQMGLIGKIEDPQNLPREGVKMMLLDENDNVVGTAMTDDQGIFKFENLPVDPNYRIKIADEADQGLLMELFMEDDQGKTAYVEQSKTGNGTFALENLPTSGGGLSEAELTDTKLQMPEDGDMYVFDNIYYPYESKVFHDDAIKTLQKVVKVMKENPELRIEVASHTDSKGEAAYNLKLSKKRTESVARYLVQNGIKRKRVISKWFGETQLAEKDMTADGKEILEAMQKNRRTTLKAFDFHSAFSAEGGKSVVKSGKQWKFENIYYEFESNRFTQSAKDQLRDIAATLKNNPELRLEVASHTDSKGPEDYNLNLSKKRSENVVRYLVRQGVKKNRVVTKWYGESQLLIKDITDSGLEIPEAMKKNRRTSFTILR